MASLPILSLTRYMNSDTKDREMITTRIINAPRELVWRAFSEPEHLALWWGPDGFTNTFFEFSFTPGGVWRFMMHGPDGTDYPNKIIYKEIVAPERITYDHSGDGEAADSDHRFTSTITLEDVDGSPSSASGDSGGASKTKVTMHMVIETAEELEKMKKFGAVEGAKQTLGRLAEHVDAMK